MAYCCQKYLQNLINEKNMGKNLESKAWEIFCLNVTQKRGNTSLHFLRNPTSTSLLSSFNVVTLLRLNSSQLTPLPQNNFDLRPARYSELRHTLAPDAFLLNVLSACPPCTVSRTLATNHATEPQTDMK